MKLIKKYSAHTLFVESMRARLEKLPITNDTKFIVEQLIILETELKQYAELSEDLLTFDAKEIAHKMAKLYESTVSLEWAAQHGGKYEKLAEVYIENTYQLRKIGDEMKTVSYFKDLVGE